MIDLFQNNDLQSIYKRTKTELLKKIRTLTKYLALKMIAPIFHIFMSVITFI